MQLWREQIREHRCPHELGYIAHQFSRQLDDISCGPSVVHHGLLLGGLTIPKAALQAMFQTYPGGTYDYMKGTRLQTCLKALGFEPEYLKKLSGESRRQFLERLGREMDRGAFALATIYEEVDHWIILGRWKDGRMRVVDSYWDPLMYSFTPAKLVEHNWGDCVQLVHPGVWQKNYEDWLPARDRLLHPKGRSLEASATTPQRLNAAAHVLNDNHCAYEQLEFCLAGKSSLAVNVSDGRSEAVAVSPPIPNEQVEQVVVVRRLDHHKPNKPGPPELVFRMSELSGWQLS